MAHLKKTIGKYGKYDVKCKCRMATRLCDSV